MNYDDLLGKPFKKGGDGSNGYDCYTLSREVCRRAGIFLPAKQSESLAAKDKIEERSEAIIIERSEYYIELKKPEPFCLVAFSLTPPFVNHMGVMIDKNHFIHVMEKRLVTIERIDNKFWKNRVEGFYKYANTNNG